MGSSAIADGLARVGAKEKDNQTSAGARGKGTAIKKLGKLASPRSNPTKGGGINRSLSKASGQ